MVLPCHLLTIVNAVHLVKFVNANELIVGEFAMVVIQFLSRFGNVAAEFFDSPKRDG